jgi:formate hydrogenlyase subunit 3/multisubunit Na+/H+ antiporter MnhD subunit
VVGLVGVAAAMLATAVLWRGDRRGAAGTFDGDPFSLFLTGVVLAALAVALAAGWRERSPGRLLIAGALGVLALSTRDLLWAVTAIQILAIALDDHRRPGMAVLALLAGSSFASLAWIAWVAGGTDLAVIAAPVSGSPRGRIGLALLSACLFASWLFRTRRALRFSSSGIVDEVVSSFVLLVAVVSVAMRLAAWLPGILEGTFLALAFVALLLGALGLLGSTRLTTFLTALVLARAGAVLAALLGDAHGRGPLLVELATSGFSALLVAVAVDLAAREKTEALHSLDDLGNLASFPARLCLLVGALSAASFPPFPGFFARFAVASAILSQGHSSALLASSVLMFLTALGAMRVVARAWSRDTDAPLAARPKGELVGLGLAAAGGAFLLVFPRTLVALATRAALSIL